MLWVNTISVQQQTDMYLRDLVSNHQDSNVVSYQGSFCELERAVCVFHLLVSVIMFRRSLWHIESESHYL